jgi:hypothetical protein
MGNKSIYIISFLAFLTCSCKNDKKSPTDDIVQKKENIHKNVELEIYNADELINDFNYEVKFIKTDSVATPFRADELKTLISANINTEAKIKDLLPILDKFKKSPNILSELQGVETFYKMIEGTKAHNNSHYNRLDSNTLYVKTRLGKNIVFTNGIDSILGNVLYSFSHFDPFIDCFVIDKSFGNGKHKIYVNRNSGQSIEGWGYPVVKNKNLFATISKTGICSDNANGFQVFSSKGGIMKLEFEVVIKDYDPENIIWIDNNTLILDCSEGPQGELHHFYKCYFEKKSK